MPLINHLINKSMKLLSVMDVVTNLVSNSGVLGKIREYFFLEYGRNDFIHSRDTFHNSLYPLRIF